jgi:hypothetical protein
MDDPFAGPDTLIAIWANCQENSVPMKLVLAQASGVVTLLLHRSYWGHQEPCCPGGPAHTIPGSCSGKHGSLKLDLSSTNVYPESINKRRTDECLMGLDPIEQGAPS